MILMQAPKGGMTFSGMPSGSTYVADADGLIKITNNSTADQTALINAGCFTLTPMGGWGTYSFNLLADLYAADTTTNLLLPGITGFPQHSTCMVLADPSPGNIGTWGKTGTGNGAGAWTYLGALASSGASAAAASAATALTAQAASASSASAAAVSAAGAAVSAAQAMAGLGIQNVLATTPAALPYEVTGISGGVGTGSGGTAGTYAGGVSGGPSGFQWTYTIDGTGKLASYAIINPGISTSNTAPTLSLPSGGLTGATVPTAAVGTIPVNRIFAAPTADGNYLGAWGNSAGSLATAPFSSTQTKLPLSTFMTATFGSLSAWYTPAQTVTTGYYLNSANGVATASASFQYTKVAVDPTATAFRASGRTSGAAMALACYYDGSGTFISSQFVGVNGSPNQYTNQTLTVPSNCATIGICSTTVGTMQLQFYCLAGLTAQVNTSTANNVTMAAAIAAAQTQISGLSTALLSWYVPSFTAVTGYYLNTAGVATAGASYQYLKVPVDPTATQVQASAAVNGVATCLACYYDNTNTFISYQFIGVNGTTTTYTNQALTVPTNAAYIGITGLASAAISIRFYGAGNLATQTAANTTAIASTQSQVTALQTQLAGLTIPIQGIASNYYMACVSMSQGAVYSGGGDSIDLSGNGANLTVLPGLGNSAWTTAGYFTSGAGTGLCGFIPANFLSFNLATQCVLFGFRVKAGAPGATEYFMGNGSPAATTNVNGIWFAARASGQLGIYINTSLGDTSTGTVVTLNTTATVFDGTDHTVMVAVDGPKGNVYVYVDGNLDYMVRKVDKLGPTGATATNSHFWFGTNGQSANTNGNTATTYAIGWSGLFHAMAFTGNLPLNLDNIAQRLYQFPSLPLTYSEVVVPTSSMVLSLVGQSNEQGAATDPLKTGQLAAPHRDPIYASYVGGTLTAGGTRGMWCSFASFAGDYGTWADIHPTAIGTTSIIHNWVGVLRAWTSSMLVTRGTYILAGGYVYKNTTGIYSNTAPVTSTVQPTHTSGTVTGGDGIAWTFMAAARSQDVAGYIYPYTDAYFDPNGFCAGALWPHQNRGGYTNKVVLISLGQTDKTMGTLSAEFSTGYQNAANYFLANNVQVALGFTCYGASTGLDAWYSAQLLPGYAAALAAFAGNPNVFAGANLRAALGVISSVGDATAVPGLQSDQLHMNNPTLPLAAKYELTAFQTAGLISTTRLV